MDNTIERHQEGMPAQIDDRVIRQAKAGDATAISALYECYRSPIYRYLYYRTGNRQTAEDLTTEVFLRVIEGLPRYRRQSVPFQAWIFQIARNLGVDHFRKMNVRNHVDLDENLMAKNETPDVAAERSLTIEHLETALQRLTADQCDVIVLRFIADMKISEVARTLNKSESAVKALQARGLAALHQVLSQRKVTYG